MGYWATDWNGANDDWANINWANINSPLRGKPEAIESWDIKFVGAKYFSPIYFVK
jgi:hypothetical protein